MSRSLAYPSFLGAEFVRRLICLERRYSARELFLGPCASSPSLRPIYELVDANDRRVRKRFPDSIGPRVLCRSSGRAFLCVRASGRASTGVFPQNLGRRI